MQAENYFKNANKLGQHIILHAVCSDSKAKTEAANDIFNLSTSGWAVSCVSFLVFGCLD